MSTPRPPRPLEHLNQTLVTIVRQSAGVVHHRSATEVHRVLDYNRQLALECIQHLAEYLANHVMPLSPDLDMLDGLRLDHLKARITLSTSIPELNDIVMVLLIAMNAIDVLPKRAPTVSIEGL